MPRQHWANPRAPDVPVRIMRTLACMDINISSYYTPIYKFRFFFFLLVHRPAHLSSSRDLDGLSNAIGGSRVDLLARLGNLGKDSFVGELGDDLGRLVLEGDFVALDA